MIALLIAKLAHVYLRRSIDAENTLVEGTVTLSCMNRDIKICRYHYVFDSVTNSLLLSWATIADMPRHQFLIRLHQPVTRKHATVQT